MLLAVSKASSANLSRLTMLWGNPRVEPVSANRLSALCLMLMSTHE